MSLPLPTALSPSKVSSFKDCALAFRFSAIDRLPEPPTTWTVKGNLVHHALEQLFWLVPAGERSLDIDPDGRLVVTDYKTGRVPGQAQEQVRLAGVHFYAFLCEQVLGERPARVQLLYLREPLSISTIPSDQSIQGLRRRTSAIWSAIERACRDEDFRPKPSPLCEYCNWQAYCPAFGGDPARAVEVLGQPTLV